MCLLLAQCSWGADPLFLPRPAEGLFAELPDPRELKAPPLREPALASPTRIVLGNGLEVLLMVDRLLPMVSAWVRLPVGRADDPADRVGLGDLSVSTMLTGGTASLTAAEFDRETDRLAATIRNDLEDHHLVISSVSLVEHFPATLRLMADQMIRPAFDPERFEERRLEAHTTISRRNEEPLPIARRELAKLIYGPCSPYARHPEHATIDVISRDDLVAWHRRHIRPDRAVALMVGDISVASATELLEDTLGRWTPPKDEPSVRSQASGVASAVSDPVAAITRVARPATLMTTVLATPGVALVDRASDNQSVIMFGHVGGRADDPDQPVFELINQIFGGTFTGRVFRRVRTDLGLAYAAWGSWSPAWAWPGTFAFGSLTRSDATLAAIREMRYQLDRLRSEPVSADELELARSAWLNGFVFRFDTPVKRAGRAFELQFWGYPPDHDQRLRAAVASVTAADIQRVARERLRPEQLHLLVVGNSARFDGSLSEFGPVCVIDVSIPRGTASASAPNP